MRTIIPATLLLLAASTSCGGKKAAPHRPPTPVKVSPVKTQEIDHYLETVGHMEAYKTVAIKAQVPGYLEEVLFENGADVKEGDLLYVIDQRPYLAALNKAQGSLEQYRAELHYAQDTVMRNSELVKQNYISENAFDQLVSDMEATKGQVSQSEAEVETAKINLGFTTIYAPISARTGFTQVFKGDLITESSTLLDLAQISPIYATFYLPGEHLPIIQKSQEKYGLLDVDILLNEAPHKQYVGKLTFINNKIDLATGMIELKASLANKNKALWPNQYVRIKVVLNKIKDAMLIPLSSIETTPKGDIVYVVTETSQIEIKPVTVGQLQPGGMIHVKTGLLPSDVVVTSGQLILYPGAHVAIQKNAKEHTAR